jgi:hypothetical protein
MAEVIEIKGKQFAVGLNWRTLPRDQVAARKANYAEHGGVVVSSKENDKYLMVGELNEGDDESVGKCSLAAKLASHSIGLSVLAVEKLGDDKYWYVLLQNGLPATGTDKVVSLAEMEKKSNHFESRIPELIFWGSGANDVVIQDINHEGAVNAHIEKFLNERCKSAFKVTKSPFAHSSRMLIKYGAMLVGAVMVWNFAISPAIQSYQEYLAQQAQESEQVINEAEQALAKFQKEMAYYQKSITAPAFLSGAARSWAFNSPKDIDGWGLRKTVCEAGSCKADYVVSTPTPTGEIKQALAEKCDKSELSKNRAVYTCHFNLKSSAGKKVNFIKDQEVVEAFREKMLLLKRHVDQGLVLSEPTTKKTSIKVNSLTEGKVHNFERSEFSISIAADALPALNELIKEFPEMYFSRAEINYSQANVLLSGFFVKKVK